MMLYKKLMVFLVVAVILSLAPACVMAAGGGDTTLCNGGICNPLGNTTDLGDFILKIVEGVAEIGYYVVVLFVIYSGFKFVKARGNDKELTDAKQTFLFTVIGAAILLGATLLANVISGTVDELRASASQQEILPLNV